MAVPGAEAMIGRGAAVAAGASGVRRAVVSITPEGGDPLDAGTISGVVESSTSISATGTAASGGAGGYTYQWYMAETSGFIPGGGNLLSGETGQNLTEQTGLTEGVTQYLKRIVTDSDTDTATSNQAQATPSDVVPFFEEDFSSGDFSNTMNGWSWGSGTRTSIQDIQPHSGTYSMRALYPAVAPGEDGLAEKRFSIGRNLSEYWKEYWLYLPDGTEVWEGEGVESAKYQAREGDGAGNNKFFRVWAGDYGDDNKHGFSVWPSSVDGEPNCRGCFETSKASGAMGCLTNNPGVDPLIHETNGPITQGEWAQIRIHVKFASTNTSDPAEADGVIEFWVDGVLVMSRYNQPIHGNISELGHDNFVNQGYYMGWANTGFDEKTYVFIDDIKWYDEDPGW
jgi:hypothetical protein